MKKEGRCINMRQYMWSGIAYTEKLTSDGKKEVAMPKATDRQIIRLTVRRRMTWRVTKNRVMRQHRRHAQPNPNARGKSSDGSGYDEEDLAALDTSKQEEFIKLMREFKKMKKALKEKCAKEEEEEEADEA